MSVNCTGVFSAAAAKVVALTTRKGVVTGEADLIASLSTFAFRSKGQSMAIMT